MESQSSEDSVLISNMTDGCVAFSDIQPVVNGWVFDYLFISVCRFFKEDKQEEFDKSLNSLEAITKGMNEMKFFPEQKMQLCGFLSRVMNGKRLDLQFESHKKIMPLMSALSIWKSFSDFVADKNLYETIKKMLFIQSAGVCLEQGCYDMALMALERMVVEYQMPEELKMKLSAVIKKKDVYHQFFLQFSFPRLVESIKTFLDSFLKSHPSDFLLKAASKVVLTFGEIVVGEDTEDQIASGPAAQYGKDFENFLKSVWTDAVNQVCTFNFSSEDKMETTANAANENQSRGAPTSLATRCTFTHKNRKQLLPKHASPWKPESGKKSCKWRPCIRGFLANRSSIPLNKDPNLPKGAENGGRKRRKKKKWTSKEDQDLKAGVQRHGTGKWSQILLDFDFDDRTGVMLKDRWRTLKKLHMVG